MKVLCHQSLAIPINTLTSKILKFNCKNVKKNIIKCYVIHFASFVIYVLNFPIKRLKENYIIPITFLTLHNMKKI